jgi:hypothetical protein
MIALTRRQKAHVLIHNAAAVAAGIGAGWHADLVAIPDVVPLSALQVAMVTGVGLLFVLRPAKALLLGLLGAFAAGLLGRGLAIALFLRLPEEEVVINVITAALLTEALGWGAYSLLHALRARSGHPSLVQQAIEATQHGPWRVLLCSTPMMAAAVGAFFVLNVQHQVEVRLRAPGGTVPLSIEYPLIERYEGTIQISGVPRGVDGRVELPVRNNVLAVELERRVLVRPPPRVRVLALTPPGAGHFLVVDRDWQVEVRRASDYWQKVRGRMYLLVLGLLGAMAMMWLGQHRSRAL